MDNNNLVAYSKVHEYLLGKLPNVNSYDDRIIAQKVGYLVQDFGIYLGEMGYFWHKRGPYSRELASALRYYEKNQENFIRECSYVKINALVIPRLEFLKNIIEKRPSSCTLLIWLEICASLRYLSKEGNKNDIDYLVMLLIKKKPFLSSYKVEMKKSWHLMNRTISV
ncbi:hypothetical protein J1TS5_03990 [Paenibacillus macerans]|uniref:hypothetical protein n=1 Tax=Paenibacillus macerans TaxID=44252 RepID=UPI001B256993|nr:hypothetical protein [Paenibacillus macerans]GIP08229.1 hypothetical protein J1TS5_03990 [Paenibacillus macerans]